MKLSKRLKTIVSYIEDKDKVLDIGCDHAYIDIYLALYKKNDLIIASDVSKDVIKRATDNIQKYQVENKIIVYCTNGSNEIKENYDTIILAGMGSKTILDILEKTKIVNKLIICSNNNWEIIRKNISSFGYFLEEETLVLESNKLYSIMLFKKGKNHLSGKEILIGKYSSKNIELYETYLKEIQRVYQKIPYSKFFKKINYYKKLRYLKSYLRKENR